MYRWFEDEIKQKAPEIIQKLDFSYEPTVTPGVNLGKIALAGASGRPLVRSDVRPEGIRMHFPLNWQDALSDWLGAPPDFAYRLKSNWVNQPSIGVATEHFDPYFKNLAAKVIELLKEKMM